MYFLRTESFSQFIRLYPIITIIIAIHTAFFVFNHVLTIFMPGLESYYYLLMGQNYFIAVEGEYWRLITPIFLHAGFTHVLFNSFSLVLFGPVLERMLGKFKFILAYLICGILANVATLYLAPLNYASVGASGAIFGLFGLYVFMLLFRQDLLDSQSRQMIMVIVIFALVMTFVNSNINIYAHIFGLIAGVALGPIILNRVRPIPHYF
ncbi:rhomboid family intramembrane serine protease [Halalkalibacillus sediminis]|uniref:Rhomboid family intramembrane serine protease n=1 Tax=Halalkalibacillus sediminis TaxID=2018042 RepID=A0A2I0QRP4_9BACI|nr:rhomboid family intramembrane serine protease [Halalkalibacillus sediminis]PKR77015.1 rhomboid family intramembrane serine protease [Halalkalibacillus sediminis]